MTGKIVSFPVIEGGKDCDEAEVMILLGKAADARLIKVVIFGVDENGDVFTETNGTELEAVGMHETAKLGYFFE